MEQELYELPGGWTRKPLGDLLNVQNGYAFDSKKFSEHEGVPLIRIRDLKSGVGTETNFRGDYQEKYIVRAGDYLIGMDGEFRCYRWKGVDALLNQRVCRLQGFSCELDPDFILYGINDHLRHIEENTAFVTVKHISAKQIKAIKFDFPPLDEQKRIVTKLDALFARIDAAIAHLQETLELSKSLFASALDRAFRECVSEKVSLTEMVDFVGGSQPPKSEFSEVAYDGYVRLIQIRDYKTDAHVVYVNAKSTKKFCKEDDVMIGRYGPPVFQILRGLEGAYNVALMKASPDESVLSKDFLYWFLQSPSIQDYIVGLSQRAAGQSGVNKKALEKYEIPLPPLDEQASIVEHFEALAEHTQTLEAETQERLDQLADLKSSLLDAAFRGQL